MTKRYLLITLCALCLAGRATSLQTTGKDKKKKKAKTEKTTATESAVDRSKKERYFLEAEKAKVTEDWENAIENYKKVLEIDAKDANAHFQLAQIYFNTSRLSDAEKEAVEAGKLDGTNKWYLEILASIYMSQGKPKEATEVYKSLITKFPNNPDYYLNLGYLYSKQGQLDNAVKIYDQFEKNFGIDEQVILQKKEIYLLQNKQTEAVNELRKLQNEYPGETDFMLMEAAIYRANRQKEKALEVYRKILETDAENPDAQLAIAEMGMATKSEAEQKESVKSIFENPKMNIDTKISILLISYIQMNGGDTAKLSEAVELCNTLVRVHPEDAKSFAMQGDVYFLHREEEKALESYKRALEINRDVFNVWQQVLAIYSAKRDWDNLLKTANEVLELYPNQPVVYLFKGTAEQQKKEPEKALKSYSKGEKMAADNARLRAQFQASLGDVYHALNKHTESDSAYEKSLKLDPDNSYVLNNYSYYLSLRKENLERAKQMSAYSNQLEPGNSSFLDTYAWILFQMKDYKTALEWQDKALAASPSPSGTLLEHYGDILFMLGKKEEALTNWRKARELGTDSSTIDKKIEQGKYLEP
ncbi:MAG: tetratricopeptide repeat protein [Bacteroidetes bacterium]|nr:tetratricopeptide repeat protein [Bacteroidota bacterium]MBK8659517.1 tetratricopeptide repeat protein [Bacteroidota bacterium]